MLSSINRWISEKMDGIRAYWDGQKLLSRQGKEIAAPREILLGLPKGIALDGELWMGRGTFEKLMTWFNSKQQDWSEIQYYVFDLPSSNRVYAERMEQLKQIR